MSAQALRSVAPEVRPLSVLCGIHPALASLDAAHQAVEIAATGRIEFASVATYAGESLDAMYLDAALFLARRDGRAADVRRGGAGGAAAAGGGAGRAGAGGAAPRVWPGAPRHDLFVVGASAAPGEVSALVRV